MFKQQRGRTLLAIGVAVGAVAVLSADGLAATKRTSAFPAQLVGTWTRTVTKADIKGAQVVPGEVDHAFPGMVVVLVVKKDGAAVLTTKEKNGTSRWEGRLVPTGPDRFHVAGIPIDVPNVYRWQVSGRLLTLTKISDSEVFGLRHAWLIGIWKRT